MVDKTWRSARWWKVLYRAPSSAPFVGWNKTNNCLHKSRCDSCSDGVAVSAEKQKTQKTGLKKSKGNQIVDLENPGTPT